jgi:hypothetical protein
MGFLPSTEKINEPENLLTVAVELTALTELFAVMSPSTVKSDPLDETAKEFAVEPPKQFPTTFICPGPIIPQIPVAMLPPVIFPVMLMIPEEEFEIQ